MSRSLHEGKSKKFNRSAFSSMEISVNFLNTPVSNFYFAEHLEYTFG